MSRVIYFEIHSTRPDLTADFYRRVFDWDIRKMDADFSVAATGAGLPGIDGSIIRDRLNRFVGVVGVASIDETVARVQEAGGEIIKPKFPVPGVGYSAYCKDPAGIVFGLIQEDMTAE